jgi:hypothetical protein
VENLPFPSGCSRSADLQNTFCKTHFSSLRTPKPPCNTLDRPRRHSLSHVLPAAWLHNAWSLQLSTKYSKSWGAKEFAASPRANFRTSLARVACCQPTFLMLSRSSGNSRTAWSLITPQNTLMLGGFPATTSLSSYASSRYHIVSCVACRVVTYSLWHMHFYPLCSMLPYICVLAYFFLHALAYSCIHICAAVS